jgi:hypothetical protein
MLLEYPRDAGGTDRLSPPFFQDFMKDQSSDFGPARRI